MEKFLTVVITALISAFFLSITIPGNLATSVDSDDPSLRHERYEKCGSSSEFTCATRHLDYLPCSTDCKTGYFCVDGYIRKYPGGPCILPIDCHE